MTNLRRYGRGLLSGFLETWRFRESSQYVRPKDAVLDLACNEGRLIDFLPKEVSYTGIDIAQNAIALARSLHPEQVFIAADLSEALPGLETKFDVVIMLAFLEHIQNPEHILHAVGKVLKPQGKIIITTPAPRGRKIHDFGARLGIFSREAADEHELFLDKDLLYKIAKKADLRVQEFHYFMFGFNQLICITRL